MKLISLGIISILLTACQPQPINQSAQPQHLACKSLIEGFLKTQKLESYQLRSIHPTLYETAEQRRYVYNTASDLNMRLNIPTQLQLQFSCEQKQNRFQLHLINAEQQQSTPLVSMELPNEQHIKQLTAFSLKTQ